MSHIDKIAITPFHSLDRYPNLKILEDFKDENWNQLYLQKFLIFTSRTHHYRQFVRISFSPNPFVFIVFILFYVLFLVCYRPSYHYKKRSLELRFGAVFDKNAASKPCLSCVLHKRSSTWLFELRFCQTQLHQRRSRVWNGSSRDFGVY